MGKIRVRFAPSPTGYLHVGSGRTALFNWLFAKHEGGEFMVRIEDTDQARSKPEFLDEILESLKWLGLNWDGELYLQSKRIALYEEHAKKLLASGNAYEGEGAIHLKMPQKKLRLSDIIHGDIEFDTSLIKDQVLIKSDGTPTYNFACVVDDAAMGITHVIRGDDHISNTPKQVVIAEALGLPLPKFCHIPLILGVDRSRLSKRHGAASIRDYRQEGFLPEALVNYLCLLGWSPSGRLRPPLPACGGRGQASPSAGKDREIISIDEAIKEFALENINKTAAVFDINKLKWLNSEYVKAMAVPKLADLIIAVLKRENLLKEEFDRNWILDIVKLFQERISTLYDFIELAGCFFKKELEYDPDGVKKFFTPETKAIFPKVIGRLNALDKFDVPTIEHAMRTLADELGIKAAKIIHPVRLAVTGKTVGAGLFETVAFLGKERTIERLERTIAKF